MPRPGEGSQFLETNGLYARDDGPGATDSVYFANGAFVIDTRNGLAIKSGPILNVAGFGPLGGTDDSAVFNRAINAAKNAGPGGVVQVPAGSYNVSLSIQNLAAGQGVTLRGAGARVTTLVGLSAATDILTLGQTGAERGDNFVIEDIGFSGGRYQLRLNNCLSGSFRRLWFSGGTTAVYAEGQNEGHVFDDLYCTGQSGNGIDVGNTNGASVAVLDLPEMQKCSWNDIYVVGCGGTYAIRHSAGVLNGQQVSGYSRWSNIRILQHQRNGFYVSQTQNLQLDNFKTEGIGKQAANTYVDFLMDAGTAGIVTGRGWYLQVDSGQPSVQYYVRVNNGILRLDGLVTETTAGGTVDVFSGDSLTLNDAVLIGGATSGIAFTGTARQRFTGSNVRNVAGLPIYGTGGQSATSPNLAQTGGTIATDQRVTSVYAFAGGSTGAILAPAFWDGQQVTVCNLAIASNTITFAAQGTSNVANGTQVVINGAASRTFVWNALSSAWI